MTQTAHTPQWDFEEEQLSDGLYYSVYDEHGDRLTMPSISKGNALFIAAAPDLLAALQLVKNASLAVNYFRRAQLQAAAMPIVDAAIAKATAI